MSSALSCTTCRMIRRSVLAFGAGVGVMYYLTGGLPDPSRDAKVIQAVLSVVIVMTGLSLWFRVKQMRAKFRR